MLQSVLKGDIPQTKIEQLLYIILHFVFNVIAAIHFSTLQIFSLPTGSLESNFNQKLYN